MKISWGTGIFLFYSFFATTLFYQVFKSTQYDHSLVVEDYYAKDLAYQSTFDKINNSNQLNTPMNINYFDLTRQLSLDFPEDLTPISGKVLLYRPDNKSLDLTLPIQVNAQNKMKIDMQTLAKGRWKVEVDWTADKVSYLNRATVDLIEVDNSPLISELK
ncbi:MAG: FixH family protein [Bacteroidota bacterium]